MSSRARLLVQVMAAVASLVLADQIARHLGLARAAGLLCLTSLATLVICARLGWRQALLGVMGLTLLAIPAALSHGDPVLATLVMTFTAFGLGLSARWQLQQVYYLMIVSLCLLITNTPLTQGSSALSVLRLACSVLMSGAFTILLQRWLVPRDPDKVPDALFPVAHSWRRSTAYGALLASTTRWHVSGLWLILVPLMVLRPFVRDSWKVALHRSLGTVAGVLLVVSLAFILPKGLPLQVPAIVLAVVTVLIAIKRGHPAVMLTAYTATIVLFDSQSADLLLMADQRLQANLMGVAITLAAMAISHPIEQRMQLKQVREAG
ncbi:FUSC family protein [Vulcanococcus sp.]|uniref:FUSC family protein n=1 Tax=Vulcanococcus sp. TaxID=2856995 RepID=UPI003F698676